MRKHLTKRRRVYSSRRHRRSTRTRTNAVAKLHAALDAIDRIMAYCSDYPDKTCVSDMVRKLTRIERAVTVSRDEPLQVRFDRMSDEANNLRDDVKTPDAIDELVSGLSAL